MKGRINSYFAILLVTIAGAGAATLIVRVASTDASAIVGGGEADYASLQQSILEQ
jgi:hypothetical protein